jgi:hypothetical protein
MQKLILKEKTTNTPSHTPLKPTLRQAGLNTAKSKFKTPFQRLRNDALFTTPKIKTTPRVKVFNDNDIDTNVIQEPIIEKQEVVEEDIEQEYCPPRTEMVWGADEDDIELLKGEIGLRIIRTFPDPVHQFPIAESDEEELDFEVDLNLDPSTFMVSF